jgi:hypothetical protein
MIMRALFVLSIGIALTCLSPTLAGDLSKIERKIVKEPTYKTKSPKYALLVFGPEAKLRVWIVTDGETVYVDRNGDGDLTDLKERFAKRDECRNIELADPDGETHYVITSIGEYEDSGRQHLMVNVDVKGTHPYQQYCDAKLAARPGDAPISHFHGPLIMGVRTINWKLPPELALHTGDIPADLNATLGTMDAERGCWVVVRSEPADGFSPGKDVHPAVEVEFPAKAADGPTIKKRYLLEKRC